MDIFCLSLFSRPTPFSTTGTHYPVSTVTTNLPVTGNPPNDQSVPRRTGNDETPERLPSFLPLTSSHCYRTCDWKHSLPTSKNSLLSVMPCHLIPSSLYRVAQNHGMQVLSISSTVLSFLNKITTAYQQLPFFKGSAQLHHLTKVSCSDLFTSEEWLTN